MQICETKIFWVHMEASVWMWINKILCISPTVYESLQSFVDFKVDMHNVYIKVRKDLAQNWTKFPFIVINDVIFVVLDSWPPEWRTLNLATRDEIVIQKQKDATKLLAQ